MKQNENIYYTKFDYNGWTMYIAATEKGLCYVGSQNEPLNVLKNWVKKHIPNGILLENQEHLSSIIVELKEYIDGKNIEFTSTFDLRGTPFQTKVWNALCTISYGETKCYSDIAHSIGNPKAVRAVGTAIGANPIAVIVPCHRVLGKDGSLTGYSGGLHIKEKLLQIENIQYKR